METFIKIDKNTIEFTKVIPKEIIPSSVEKTQYEYSFLVTQKVAVEGDLANIKARHITELAEAQKNVDEVLGLLLECAKLGIKEAVVIEPVIIEEVI